MFVVDHAISYACLLIRLNYLRLRQVTGASLGGDEWEFWKRVISGSPMMRQLMAWELVLMMRSWIVNRPPTKPDGSWLIDCLR